MSSSNEHELVEDGNEEPDVYEALCQELKHLREDPYFYCPPDLLPQTEGEVKRR
jgi:hypothetical protein